jgi:SAM-dependent methyltransferase
MEMPLPFPCSEFDAVLSLEGIEHVFNPSLLFDELSRVLKPGGMLIITTPNLQNLATRWQHLCCGYPFQFDPFDKIPLKHTEIGDKGHISPVFYTQLRYYAENHDMEVLAPRGGDVKERALKLIFSFPFLLLGVYWTWRDWKKTSQDVKRLQIRKHLFSWPMLHSRSLIFLCRKKKPNS